jgi:hypothetical protein
MRSDTGERGPVVVLALPFRYRYEINLLARYTRPEPGLPLGARGATSCIDQLVEGRSDR